LDDTYIGCKRIICYHNQQALDCQINHFSFLEKQMPSFALDDHSAAYHIRGYQPGLIQINEMQFSCSLMLTPEQLIQEFSPQHAKELSAESLAPLHALKLDIVLIGTGGTLVFLPPEIYGNLINLGIGVEVMNTAAACRTFNALASEGRRVAAVLIAK
jgi:uncharacterized protein